MSLILPPRLWTPLVTLLGLVSLLPQLAAGAPPIARPEVPPDAIKAAEDAGHQTIVTPWGTLAGMRVEGEWIRFEAGVRIVHPDWSGFRSAVKYLQRPRYSRAGNRRTVTSTIDNLKFTVAAQDLGVGEAELEVEATVPPGLATAGVFWCFEVPAEEFAGGSVEVLDGQDHVRLVLAERRPGSDSNYLEAAGQVVRLVGRRQRLEILLSHAVEVRVRREASDHPTSLNDPKVAQTFIDAREGDAAPFQVYLKLAGSDAPPDERGSLRLKLKAGAVADPEPAHLTLDATHPGQPFDGMGGNFRLQFPETDATVIRYNLDHLPLAWGRVDMPWADWDPDESASGLEAARAGRLPQRVKEAMEMARTLSRRGMPVIVSAWFPPRWARLPGPQPTGLRGVALDREKMPRICRSLADYLVFLEEHYQVETVLFSFNEPETGVEVRQTPAEHVEFVKAMGAELQQRGLNTRLLLGDTAHGTPAALQFIGPALADAGACRYVGAVGFHTWRGCNPAALRQWSEAARRLGVPLLVTEAGPDAHLHEYAGVRLEPWFQLQEIDLYLRICAQAQPATIMEWQLTTDYSVLKGGGVYGEPGPLEPTQRFWNLKQLGMTPPGARAFPVASDNREITAAAFGTPEGALLAVHLVNNGGERPAILRGLPERAHQLRRYVTDASRGMVALEPVDARDGAARFTLPAASFVTLLLTGPPDLPATRDTAFDAPGNFNPLVPGYFADPTIKQFGDTFYLYATTDGNGGGRGPATVWVSRDFVNWVLVPMNWPTTPHYWAPDVVKRPDGRYYLFYNQPCNTFAGVSDTPIGPWTPLTPGDGLVIRDRLIPEVITLDTQFFEDRDGTLYGYWGTWGIFPKSGCGLGEFNPDMKSFARLGLIPNTQAKDFFEAPFMLERNGVYYFTYSSGSCHDASYRVQYGIGDRPDGEFKMGPNNPILETTADGRVHGPGHHSILRQGDDYFIIYHRHDLPVTPNGMHRQTCADRLVFEADGVIRKVEPTHRGIGPLGSGSGRRESPANLALAGRVTASSFYQDTLRNHSYKPEYAVDDNNATLWRPGDNRMGHWLSVDLGTAQRVRRTATQFEYGTWFYQYLIECSLDGRTWQIFADRRQNTRWGSPMVDDGDVETRYLRLTVTGTEFPGLFGAVWNFKAYAEAPEDPLLAMANEAFAKYVTPNPGRSAAQSSVPQDEEAHPNEAGKPTNNAAAAEPNLLIHLDVAGLQLGAAVSTWTNHGALAGEFRSRDHPPVANLAAGCKAVQFSGNQVLAASFSAPRALSGNSSFTVTAWVNNPVIGESECFLSWAGRGGPDATTAQFGYGTQPEFGAVGHWGFADMGFRGGPPQAGVWHHLAVVFDGVIERVYVDGRLNHAEAKMLLMHEGRPVYVGASEPGTEFFDGYLASLRVYDGALNEARIQELATQPPEAEVLVHVDSARLDEGSLRSWVNGGSLGGAFVGEPGPVVAEVNGRLAPRFETGQTLELVSGHPVTLQDFTLLAGAAHLASEQPTSAVELIDDQGKPHALLPAPPTGGWQHLVLVYARGRGALFIDGRATPAQLPPPPTSLRAVRLGGRSTSSGALTRVQLFRRALSAAEIAQLHALWQQDWQTPTPNPAAFAQPPTAFAGTVAVLTAVPGHSPLGKVEYRFTETTGHPGATSSGWTPNAFFLDDDLQPQARYRYRVTVRDPMGNVTTASAPVEVLTDPTPFQEFIDRFETDRDYFAQGAAGTLWDGFLGLADHSQPELIAARSGTLHLQSKGTVWDGGQPLGAFLFKSVTGDFVVETTVADYAGLATRKVPGNNDGGLMVRVPELDKAGPGEDLLQLNFFPIWNQGNMVTTLDGGRRQQGNGLAWDAHRHLQIIRHGTRFHFRTSTDGRAWQDMPGSPVEREDLAGLPLQVGLYHASYGGDSSFVAFREFRLVRRK